MLFFSKPHLTLVQPYPDTPLRPTASYCIYYTNKQYACVSHMFIVCSMAMPVDQTVILSIMSNNAIFVFQLEMGTIFESEVSNDRIVKVLQHVQQYLPTVGKDEEIKFAEKRIVGDQLTIRELSMLFNQWLTDTHLWIVLMVLILA